MWRKNSWYLGIIFLILLSNFVLANCDWGVGVISDNIFENYTEFKFTTRVYEFHENETNIDIIYSRKIENIYGNIVKEYNNLTCIAKYDKNCNTVSPNLDPETYLIKVEIFPDCNDTNLENNYDEKLIVILLEEKLEENYTKLEITELFPDPQGYDNDPIPGGEWIELYNYGDEDLDLTGCYFEDDTNHKLIISDTKTLSGTIIKSNDYLVIYVNGYSDLLKNKGLEELEFYDKNDNLIDEVSYSGSIEGLTWGKVNDIWKLTLPTPDSDNFYNESINESKLEIEKVYQEKFKFGDVVRVKIHVYKGNTDRYSIQIWIEDEDGNEISKRSRASLYRKFADYDLVLPIQIFSNCEEGYDDGDSDIIVEGLGLKDDKEIEIKGNEDSMCETVEKEIIKEISPSITGLSEKDINTDYSVEYTSKEVKERRLAIYFFCVILIVMLIYFGLSKND